MSNIGPGPAQRALRLGSATLLAVASLLPLPARAADLAAGIHAVAGSAARIATPRPGDTLAGAADAAPAIGAPPSIDAPGEAGGLAPTIHYLDALAHQNDVIDFPPGDRVAVGFTPRVDDSWTVDGGRATSLPAGRVAGTISRRAAQGSTWSEPTLVPNGPAQGAGSDPGASSVDQPRGPSAAATLASAAGAPGSTVAVGRDAPVNLNGLRREVFGFVPYWELSSSSTTYDWSVLSTVAYFSVGCDSGGNLLKQNSDGSVTTGWGGWTSAKMTSLITAAHQHGTRVVLTISCFAWTAGQQTTQSTLLGSPTARANLAKQVAAAVAERGADGVNLDFEPIVSGYADAFTALVRGVRSELNAIAPGYQLTFDTTGYIGNYPLEAATAAGGADAIFIMGYDYRGSSSTQAGSISPLTGPVYDLTDTVSAYTARVSPSKLILGVPYYGRAWSTDTDSLHAKNISGTQYGTSVTALYSAAVDLAAQYGRRYDAVEQAPWTAYQKQTCTTTYGCVTAWRQLYFDDAASLKLRYDLINQAGLRGAGIWALGYDDTRPELYKALADKFLHDTTPPVAGIETLPVIQTSTAFDVRWTGRDESTIVGYDIQVAADGGAWTDWKVGTVDTNGVYIGLDGHAYAFRVRARDSHGNLAAWTVTSPSTTPTLAIGGFGTVVVNNLNLRVSAGTSAASVGTVNSGDVVAVTAGPVVADGFTWYAVTAPIAQWAPVDQVDAGVWVAVGNASSTYVVARAPIYATSVSAVIRDFRVANVSGTRVAAPNDPTPRPVTIQWTNAATLTELQLNVFGLNGSLLDSRSIDRLPAGPQSIDFDGRVAGSVLPLGTYLLQLAGRSAGAAVFAPSATTVSPELVSAYGVTVDPAAGATYVPLTPARLLDTRFGNGLTGAFGPNVPRSFVVAGRGGVPANAVAVTGTLTITSATRAGYVSLTPTSTANPTTSTVNFPAGDTRANSVTVPLGPDGSISAVFKASSGSVHIIFDVTGYLR